MNDEEVVMDRGMQNVVTAVFVEGQIRRLRDGLRQLLVRRAMQEVGRALEQVGLTIRDDLTPALVGVEFQFQRFGVELLLASPWWRHLRARWQLRKACRWADVYPSTEAPR